MQYQKPSSSDLSFKLESRNLYSILGLYFFSLGTVISGYSLYLLLEVVGSVERNIISWNGEGLFWFLILFFGALFILFLPVEFLGSYRLYNGTFKDLMLNIIYCIFISLLFLFLFQYLIEPQNSIMYDVSSIGKATSFSGFIAVPIFLFLQHSLRNRVSFLDKVSYSSTLLIWILSSQLFL